MEASVRSARDCRARRQRPRQAVRRGRGAPRCRSRGRRRRARRTFGTERRREVDSRQDRVRTRSSQRGTRGGLRRASRLAGGSRRDRLSRGVLPLSRLDECGRAPGAAPAPHELRRRRARTCRPARARRPRRCARTPCRGDVQGNAAAARNRAGPRPLAAPAAAGRADQRARPGREANGAHAARGTASTRHLRSAELAPPERGRARLRPRRHPAGRQGRQRRCAGGTRPATRRRDRDRCGYEEVRGCGTGRHSRAGRRTRPGRKERLRRARSDLDARRGLRRGRGRREPLTAVWTIAGYGLREALRRKVFVVVCLLTVAFLLLYWMGNRYVFNHVGEIVPPAGIDAQTFAGAFLFGMAMFGTLFLGVVLAVFLTLGVVRGDAERGLLQPLVVRPIGRSTVLAARFLGSVFLSGIANGIAVFMLFGAGLVAGLLDNIGHVLNSGGLVHAAKIAAWIVPFEALYQDALRTITENTSGLTGFLLRLGPFGGAEQGGVALRLWAIAYLGIVGALALAGFARRDL